MAHASHLQSDEKGILKEIPLQLFHENTFLLFIERKERNISVQNIQEKNKDLFFLSTSPTSIKGGGGMIYILPIVRGGSESFSL